MKFLNTKTLSEEAYPGSAGKSGLEEERAKREGRGERDEGLKVKAK